MCSQVATQVDAGPEDISASEFQDRVIHARAAVAAAGLAGLIAYADCWRGANVTYFTRFRPLDGVSDVAMALLLLPVEDEPTLFVSEMCLAFASSETTFPVRPFRDLDAAFAGLIAGSKNGQFGLAGSAYIPALLLDPLRERLGGTRLEITSVLADLKAVKSPAEVRLLRKAAVLTDAAMAAIQRTLADGRPHSERELAQLADATMISGGADRTAYDTMVQTGPRSAYNLARPTDRVLQPGDLVMTDIGARYRGYVADGGRGFTYGPGGPEKIAIVKAAASAVEAGIAAARPGITAADLNAVVQHELVRLGYEKYSGEARGHGTGHGTGMDPEEESPWIGPGNTTVLVEDMVFTLKATITVPEVGGLRTERILRLARAGCETLDSFPMELYW